MKRMLAPRNRELLRNFLQANVLLAFDYDGTLAPIVTDPEQAHMRESTRNLLDHVARAYPCVVISGRARADVARRLGGAPVRDVVGNHGSEPFSDAHRLAAEVQRFRPVFEQRLSRFPGVQLEDKRFSIAVHYRLAKHKAQAREIVAATAAELGHVRLIGGKQIINVLPEGAPDKGRALEQQRVALGCDRALFVGDDETDEDVFARAEAGRVLSVRIGPRRASRASFYLRSQLEMDEFLMEVLAARSPSVTSSARN